MINFELFIPFILLVCGFGFLVKGAGWFVDGSAGIAKRLGVSQLVIALTVVAIGTSIPETAVSLQAALQNRADLSVGNILGSNILNILLILGITALISPTFVQRSTVRYEMVIMIGTAFLFGILGLGIKCFIPFSAVDGTLSRLDGVLMIAAFFAYLIYLWYLAKKVKVQNALVPYSMKESWGVLLFILVCGLVLVIAGSSLTIRGAVKIAAALGVSQRIIGLTIVAFGTSLPELATSIMAAIKKQDEIAVGNIVGSNIYNMLFIGGLTAIISPLPYQASFAMDSLICIVASVLLWLCVKTDPQRRISRLSGVLFLVCYAAYLVWLLGK